MGVRHPAWLRLSPNKRKPTYEKETVDLETPLFGVQIDTCWCTHRHVCLERALCLWKKVTWFEVHNVAWLWPSPQVPRLVWEESLFEERRGAYQSLFILEERRGACMNRDWSMWREQENLVCVCVCVCVCVFVCVCVCMYVCVCVCVCV